MFAERPRPNDALADDDRDDHDDDDIRSPHNLHIFWCSAYLNKLSFSRKI
jgi:hypothetical protein